MLDNQSEKIQEQVDFLKHDVNFRNDYTKVPGGKRILNLPKHQYYNTSYSGIQNYFIGYKNGHSTNPFNGSSSFYIDFEIPKL